MTDPRTRITTKQIEQTMKNLRKNRMEAYFVPTKADVVPKVAELLHEGDTVAVGGSMSLFESGVIDLLRNGQYRFLDRYEPELSAEQTHRLFLDSLGADAYLCSSNAVTMNGELFNVDGHGNRVAALCFGPRSVILVVGCQKIVPDLDAAIEYVKKAAAPCNAARLDKSTYCVATGVCKGLHGDMTDGCESDARICATYVVSAHQRNAGRIKVILVGEPLGY